MTNHHLTFSDSISFLPIALHKLPEAFGLTASKFWYPRYFNMQANLNYVGAISGIEHYGVDKMNDSERKEFMAWYDTQKDKVFDNRHVLQQYYQDDFTFLRRRVRYFVRISLRSETLMCF